MEIYKINFSLLTFFLTYLSRLKGRAECRQTEVQTNKQTISVSCAKELANKTIQDNYIESRHRTSLPCEIVKAFFLYQRISVITIQLLID